MNAEWMTVQEAAVFLGISATSVKRLCDANQLESARTQGGHRRIHRQHVEGFQLRLNPRVHAKNSNRSECTVGSVIEALEADLLRGDAFACWSQITEIISQRCTLIEALEHFLVPALWRIGDRWQRDEISIYQEHLATHICEKTLDRLLFQMKPPEPSPYVSEAKKLAVGGALGKSRDSIASKLVEIVFLQHGFHALNFGPFLPVESLIQAARDTGATWVWCSYTHLEDPQDFIDQQTQLAARLPAEVHVVVGGGAVSPAIRRTLQRAIYLESLTELEGKLRENHAKAIPAPHFR